MSGLMAEMAAKALKLNIPLSVQLDLTYRCNERCIHCYLDHDDHGEMTTAEIKGLLDQMADAGVFFLTISGGEIMMRRDFFEILEHAHARTFSIKLKTNGVLIRKKEAERMRALGVESVQISVYSHRAEVHDAITKMPGSFRQSIEAIRLLRTVACIGLRGAAIDGRFVNHVLVVKHVYAREARVLVRLHQDTWRGFTVLRGFTGRWRRHCVLLDPADDGLLAAPRRGPGEI